MEKEECLRILVKEPVLEHITHGGQVTLQQCWQGPLELLTSSSTLHEWENEDQQTRRACLGPLESLGKNPEFWP